MFQSKQIATSFNNGDTLAVGNATGHASTTKEQAPALMEMSCDDCARQPRRLLRWCIKCEKAICDACVLDRHGEHQIGCYQKAWLDAKAGLNKEKTRMKKEMDQLISQRQTSIRLQAEVIKKICDNDTKIQNRIDDAIRMRDTMKRRINELENLAHQPLTGKTIVERRHATESVRTLGEQLLQSTEIIEKQVEAAKCAMDETYVGYDKV